MPVAKTLEWPGLLLHTDPDALVVHGEQEVIDSLR
jgi:hypothetical protein